VKTLSLNVQAIKISQTVKTMSRPAPATPDYGNWVSKRIIYFPTVLGSAFLVSTLLFWPLAIPAALFLVIAAYFTYARYLFSPNGKNIQNQIWDSAITNIDWNGVGKALDIGCGNGALSIKLAKKFPSGQVTGIDFWGERWEYSKSACEANAKAEVIAGERCVFQKASASKLPFPDEFFDAAISNLCFHEVSDIKDKREVIREALRVIKKGGKFAFQDLFLPKQIYGDKEKLVSTIKSWGITEVEFVDVGNTHSIPWVLKLPFMIGPLGIIKGEK
jgi:SAM-dependent methyltransferase